MISWWGKLHPILFPWVPKSVEQYVSILFWHSILLTSTTPLFRMFNNNWRGESSLYYLMSLTMPGWLVEHCLKIGFVHPGIDYAREGEEPSTGAAPVGRIDVAFGLHAGFALVWLVCAYIQMVHTRKRWVVHRTFGYISALSFCCHVGASCFNLYMDIVQHKPLPRIMLVISSMNSAVYMINAIRVVIKKPKGWANAHKDLMMLCFMFSIQGAGPIRMIAQVQTWLGCGPVQCQNENGGMATNCMWAYVFRMYWIAFYTMYTRGIYCKMRNDATHTLDFLRDFRSLCLSFIAMLAFSYIPNSEWLLAVVLGRERTLRGSLTVFLFGAFQLYDGLKTTEEPAVTKRKTLRSDSSLVDDVTISAGDMLDEKNPNAQCNLDSCCRSKHRRSTAPLRLCKAGLPSPVITCEKKAAYNSGKLDTISRVRSLIMLT